MDGEGRGAEPSGGAFVLKRVRGAGFRNLAAFDLAPGPGLNVVSGPNGAGKSNVLEAIGLLCAGRSFRGARLDALLQEGAEQGWLQAEALVRPVREQRRIEMARPRHRRLLHEGKRPRSVAWWRARWPVVWFHPGSLQVSAGPPQQRRDMLDGLLELLDPSGTADRQAYERALRSRNRLLKEGPQGDEAMGAYEQVLARHGPRLVAARRAMLRALGPLAERAFAEISGARLELSLRYVATAPEEPAEFLRSLQASRAHDVRLKRTTLGPHLDEVAVRLGGAAARHRASQGQHRAVALALVLAQAELLADRLGRRPLLLLDDVSSELDPARNARFFEAAARRGGQLFVTTTDARFVPAAGPRCDWRIEDGRLRAA